MGRPERMRCPSEDLLFRWSAGEAPAWRHRPIAAHVASCERCAAQLRAWDAALEAYRRHDGPIGMAAAIAGPGDEEAARGRFEARLRREPRVWRVSHVSRWMPGPQVRWLHAAAALLLVTIGMLWLRPAQATLSAEALIAGAIDREQQAPQAEAARAGLVTIAPVGRAQLPAGPARAMVAARGAEARELAQRLAMYAFDWRAPLSARPFQRWRASAASRADALEWVDASLVRLSTSANQGAIRRAELMLHMPGFHPVAQIWRFADGFAVELRLLDPSHHGAPATVFAASPPASGSHAAANRAIAPSWSIDDAEIELRGGLERAGVMLDRQVAIRRGGATLVIDGRASPVMARRITAVVRELPQVESRVRARGGAGRGDDRVGAAPSAGAQLWLDRTFDGSPLHDTFFARTGDLERDLRDALAVLDELGARYPASSAARLTPGSRRGLQRLTQAYFRRVTGAYERLEAHLAPLVGSVSRRMLPAQAPAGWRDTPTALAADLERLSAALTAVLTAPSDSAAHFEALAHDRVRPALAAVAPR